MNRRTYHHSRPYPSDHIIHSDLLGLLLFYILPFLIVNGILFFLVTTMPKYELVVEGTNDYRTTDITFTIKSSMPLKETTIKLDSQPLDLVKIGKKKYKATITHNGSLEIYMVNFNRMALLEYEHIDILDDEPPTIEDYSSEDGILSFTIADTQSGVDFSSIRATSSTGGTLLPLAVDKASGKISFAMNASSITVSAKDRSGNEFLTTFSLNTQEPADPSSETTAEAEPGGSA